MTDRRVRLVLASALAVTGCGGKVVFDGAGGAASSSASKATSTTGSSSSSTGGCTSMTPPSGHDYVVACVPLPGDACESVSSPSLLAQLKQELDTSMPCQPEPQFCSCLRTVAGVLCENGPPTSQCCYEVDVSVSTVCE